MVTDPAGAPVPQTQVGVTNTATKVSLTATTNNTGVYTVPYLSSGSYRITVNAQGFESLVRAGISLHVDEQVKLDFTLKVGTVKETVTISAEAPLINTATATSGQVVDQRCITELPLPDGNPDQVSVTCIHSSIYGPLMEWKWRVRTNGFFASKEFGFRKTDELETARRRLSAKG